MRQWRSTAPGALPSSVVSSTVPSPVTAKRGAAQALVEARELEHDLGALLQLAAEPGERGAEPAARAGAGQVAVGRELPHRGEAMLELVHRLRARALLRAEDAGRSARAEQRVPHVAEHAQRHAPGQRGSVRAQVRAAVDRRRPADADEHRGRPGHEHRDEQLAEPGGRRDQRVALRLREQPEPDRLRRLDDRRPVGQHQPARGHRPAERVGRGRLAPLAAERPREHLRGSLAAVGDRQLVARPARRRAARLRRERPQPRSARGRP